MAAQQLQFERLGIQQGLSQSTVFSVTQDSAGFLWIGTLDGLNRFDGNTFKIYKHHPGDTNSIAANSFYRLYPLQDGSIAASTLNSQINIVSTINPNIKRLNMLAEGDPLGKQTVPRAMVQDSSGNFWIGTDDGIIKYSNDFSIRRDFALPVDNRNESIVFDLFCYRNKKIIGSMYNRIVIIDMTTDRVSFIPVVKNRPMDMREVFLRWAAASDSLLLIGGDRSGIYILDVDRDAISVLPFLPHLKRQFTFSLTYTALFDHEGNLWIGTDNGLLKVRITIAGGLPSVSEMNIFRNDPADPKSLSHNSVLSLHLDKENTLWIGTSNGLNKVSLRTKKFITQVNEQKNLRSIPDGNVWTFIESLDGSLFVGTQGGYAVRKRGENSFRRLYAVKPVSSARDSSGRIWFGTRGELVQVSNDRIISRVQDPSQFRKTSKNFYSSLFTAHDGALWSATSYGLVRYHPAEKKLVRFLAAADTALIDNSVYLLDAVQRRNGTFWTGTNGGGLGRLNLEDSTFRMYRLIPGNPRSLSDNVVIDLLETSDRTLWAATLGGGINKIVEVGGDSLEFTHYREDDGLPTDAVYGMLEDERGNLWLSTNKGISRFNPKTGKFRTFTSADGLQGDEFNQNAFFKAADGKMYFGGINGFNEFYPDSVYDNTVLPNIVVTEFRIFEKDFSSLLFDSVVSLNYDQNYFSFEFTSLSLIAPKNNRYSYILEGLEKEWTNSGDRRTAHYTDIDPGEYTFRVRGTNNDGVWNMVGTSVRIIITPPWWATVWFRGFALFVFVGSIAVGAWYISRRKLNARIDELERQKSILEERQRTRDKIARDLHDDVATTISSISLYAEMMHQRTKKRRIDLEEAVKKISSLSSDAKQAMEEVVWSLSPKNDTLNNLVDRMGDVAAQWCSDHSLQCHLAFCIIPSNIIISEEIRKNVYLIFKEAMNNILKHSNADAVELISWVENEFFYLTIRDNGKGLSPVSSKTKTIGGNGLLNMGMRAKSIGAELNIASEKNKGTSISVIVKIAQLRH
ncbi:MAG: two-component regulator propeller domain-containing protein [Bacteroidota bacterium]